MSILNIENLNHSYGDKLIFSGANMLLATNDKIGLVGRNGSGKSTLINIIAGEIVPDSGLVQWSGKTTYGYLDQYAKVDESLTINEYLKTAFANLYELEGRLRALTETIGDKRQSKAEQANAARVAGNYQLQLEAAGFYDIQRKINIMANGLGISDFGDDALNRKLGTLSGGQRAKVMLAKLLLERPKVLLLDEPTNFLDQQHIEWLSKTLREYSGSFIVVSHDNAFLNGVTNTICFIENFRITRFAGNYDAYIKQLSAREEEYAKRYSAQQKYIAKTEDYIRKNLVRASTSNMAKSRRKQLEKLERLDKPQQNPKPHFNFPFIPLTTANSLEVKDLEIGYYFPILPKLNLRVNTGDSLVIRGCNGIGKSTFVKTIVGAIPKLKGSFQFGAGVVYNYFRQDTEWESSDATPYSIISDIYPTMDNKAIRSKLAACGLRADLVTQPILSLSGGEQTKVRLTLATLIPSNFLILDEPTNHLDNDAKEALLKALKGFKGSVLLVCHEQSFYERLTDNVFDAEELYINSDL